GTAFTQDLLPGIISITPAAKVSLNKPEISVLKRYDIYILCMGLLIYKLDAIEKCPKDIIKQRITSQYDRSFFDLSGVNFDLENIDYFRTKGFTRYYPFYANEKPFVIRIFRTDEKYFQPDVEILYEGSIKNPPVTFQISKGVNAILEHCKLKPQQMPSQSQAETYP
ncbi:MAG: hypothetical protein KAU58_00495, partial [Candidatus Omnitrophica bacterium]|nr:hypothetical protein [Candidatus Omnitrophota bacterium]